MLVGRTEERGRLHTMLDRVAAGGSSSLVIRGEAGIGKSVLLHEAQMLAEERLLRTVRARGVESESDIPFAGLSELLAELVDLRDRIPAVQAEALEGALALGPPSPRERFTVPAAVFSLLAAAAEERPLLAIVDDAQWMDESSFDALLFAARRLREEGVGILFGVRDEPGLVFDAPGIEELRLGALTREEALELLAATEQRPTAGSVAERLVQATGGNPLAISEIPALLTDDQLAGRASLGDPLPLGASVEGAFGARLAGLNDDTRKALLLAASTADPALAPLVDALRHAGLEPEVLEAAESADLLALEGAQITWRHPLVRSTVYHAATQPERRAAHRTLAESAPVGSARRAWHLASAAVAADEEVAAALEEAANEARSRSAVLSAAHALSRAGELTPDAEEKSRRLLLASYDYILGGRTERALAAAEEASRLTQDTLRRADARRIVGNVIMRLGRQQEALDMLVNEADIVQDLDPVRATAMLLEAGVAHMMSGDMHAMAALASRARDLAAGHDEFFTLLASSIVGDALLALGRTVEGDAMIAGAEPFLMEVDPAGPVAEVIGMAGHCSIWIDRWDRADAILTRLIDRGREAAAVGRLPHPLAAKAQLEYRRGQWPVALALAVEGVRLGEVTGQISLRPYNLGVLAEIEAALGHEEACRAHVEEGLRLCEQQGADAVAVYLHAALGLLELGLGNTEAAAATLDRASEMADRLNMEEPALVLWAADHAEALVRVGRVEDARDALEVLETRTELTGRRWGRAACHRIRGLLAEDIDESREHFLAALAEHENLPMPFERARTQLALAERLRRARRRAEAREPLEAATRAFDALGAKPWSDRAQVELRASGHGVERASGPNFDELTPHELQVALLVAQGQTNREVAGALFISARTVEHHLTRIYRKLGVRSRTELASRFQGDAVPASSAA